MIADETGNALYEKALKLAQANRNNLLAVEPLLRQAAALGSADAIFALGTWYFFGDPFERSVKKALTYYRKAAKLGSVNACLELGKIYQTGEIVAKNHHKTIEYYVMALALGSGQAYYELARAFCYGTFTAKNVLICDKLMEKAEDLGFSDNWPDPPDKEA